MTAADMEMVLVPRRKIKTDLVEGVPRTQMPEYNIWRGMISRCSNKAVKAYSRYGGRGISVCERWSEDFKNFYLDVGPRPTPKHSVDRIDNDGNYEPGNVRWATSSEQSANKSTPDRNGNWFWTDDDVATLRGMWDKFYPVTEIASVIGKSAGTVRLRAHKLKLHRNRAISIMVKKNPELVHLLHTAGVDRFTEAVAAKTVCKIQEERGRTAKQAEDKANAVMAVLNGLGSRGAKMREMRLSGCTLDEIGKAFGITRERVRQIEAKGFPSEVGGGLVSGRDRKISNTKPEVRAKKIERLCRAWNAASREAKAMFINAAPNFIASDISLIDVVERADFSDRSAA